MQRGSLADYRHLPHKFVEVNKELFIADFDPESFIDFD